VGSPLAYWTFVAAGALITVVLCVGARRRAGAWTLAAARLIALVLVVDAATFIISPVVDGTWTVRASLPLDLCDVALLVAAVACWRPDWSLGVELTYFWGMAGTLQAVITPDLSASFPHLAFLEFVVAHLGIVMAALYLVVGLRRYPRPHAVPRIFAITLAYTAVVALVDWASGANYMYLAHIPGRTSLLSVLGPWPWYILAAAGVAIVVFVVLDAPFHRRLPSP
jgi:hypothetical integral membrane protein (TIGR02206 family)